MIDVGGVGYAVTITAAAFRALPAAGQRGAPVHLHPRRPGRTAAALRLRRPATSGACSRRCSRCRGSAPRWRWPSCRGWPSAIWSGPSPGGDVARLTQIRGVGRKIAERLAVELRDKIAALGAGGGRGRRAARRRPPRGPSRPGRLGEVHGALVALGYRPAEFEGLLGGPRRRAAHAPTSSSRRWPPSGESSVARKRHDDGEAARAEPPHATACWPPRPPPPATGGRRRPPAARPSRSSSASARWPRTWRST